MTTPNSVGEQSRKAFEAWRRQTTKMNPDDAVALEGLGDEAPYVNKITRVMHIAWKAAWQARATLSTRVEGVDAKDAARYRKLKEWFAAANFCPEDMDLGEGVALIFLGPVGMEVSADLDSTIDPAISP